MKLHHITLKQSEFREIYTNNRDFIISDKNDIEKGDLINFNYEAVTESIINSDIVVKVTEIVKSDKLQDGYCIICFNYLKLV